MIVKGDKVSELNVLAINTGEKIDTVKELIYDPEQNRVRGFLIDEGGWFSEAKVILIDDVKSIGKDALMVDSTEAIKRASDVRGKVAFIAEEGHYLTHTRVITEGGNELGKVTDIYFDSETGNVIEFEVSQGVVEDVKGGKKRFRLEDIVTVGKEATIVRSFIEVAFEKQSGEQGLEGAFNQAKDKASEAWTDFKEEASEAAQAVKDKTYEVTHSPEFQDRKERIKETLSELKDDVQEKYDAAKLQGVLAKEELEDKYEDAREAVSSGDVSDKAKGMWEEAKDNMSEVRESLVGRADQAKDYVGSKKEEVKDYADEKKEDIRINTDSSDIDAAVGKYVKVNVLTGNNEVLLERGEMITYEKMRKAIELGLKERVLNNLSDEPVV